MRCFEFIVLEFDPNKAGFLVFSGLYLGVGAFNNSVIGLGKSVVRIDLGGHGDCAIDAG